MTPGDRRACKLCGEEILFVEIHNEGVTAVSLGVQQVALTSSGLAVRIEDAMPLHKDVCKQYDKG